MMIRAAAIAAVLAASSEAFTTPRAATFGTRTVSLSTMTATTLGDYGTGEGEQLPMGYGPGKADTEFARRFGHLVGAKVKSVGETMTEFTSELGFSVNALYKNIITDIIGVTHLIVVNARFQRDPIWCAGILKSLDMILKNYPEPDVKEKLYAAFFTSMGMQVSDVRAEAAKLDEWATGKTMEEVEAALKGEDGSFVADVVKNIKEDEYWLYSRYFGIGLVRVMELIGVEQEREAAYDVMENWMTNFIGKKSTAACADSDLYFKAKTKLDLMETMMKEIEIREKKRMADRLEAKAEAAIKAAEEAEKKAAEPEKEEVST